MYRPDSGCASKRWVCRRHLSRTPNRLVLAGVIAPAAWLVAGCSAGGADVFKTAALPSAQSADAAAADGLDLTASADRLVGPPDVTPAQRSFLDDLTAVGVHPANDLRALAIGTYVCQARAAGQSEQVVRDAVTPMVRSDVTAAGTSMPPVSVPPVGFPDTDAAVGHFIGIAQQRLC